MTDDCISPLLPLALLIVTCETAFPSCFEGTTFCLTLLCRFFIWLWLKADASVIFVCAPSDDGTSLELSLFSLILLTWYCQYRSWTEKNHAYFCGFLVVCFLASSSRTSYTYRTLYIHTPNHKDPQKQTCKHSKKQPETMKNIVTLHHNKGTKPGTTGHKRKSSKLKENKQKKLKQAEQLTTSCNKLECIKCLADNTWERTVQTWSASNWGAPSATLRERASARAGSRRWRSRLKFSPPRSRRAL